MDNVVKGALLILLGIVFAIGVGSFIFAISDLDVATPIKNAAGIAQALATVAAVVLGGVFAYRNGLLFRTFEPHLTMVQTVTHRRISDQRMHVGVTVTLSNSSKVKVEIHQAEFILQRIAPLTDTEVELLDAQVSEDEEVQHIQWPVLDEWQREWESNELIVEPGGSHQEVFEFIIEQEPTSLLAYSYFYNSDHSRHPQSAQGWSITSFHDIVTRG